MLVQNGALRGEGDCDEDCTVLVAIRLRPVAVTWACLLGSSGDGGWDNVAMAVGVRWAWRGGVLV